MSAPGLLVSVVVPTYQRRESVLRALRALAGQDLPADSFEVLVSIDGSDDGTREAIDALSTPYRLRRVDGPKRGRAAARNDAIRLAEGEIVVFLDDDMEPTPRLLSQHYRNHPTGSRVCVLGAVPIATDSASTPVAQYIAQKFNTHLTRLGEADHAFVLRDFYSGNTSVRCDVLEEVGAFEEAFTLYGNEDLELSVRLREAGVEICYDRDAIACQHHAKGLADLAEDNVEKGRTAVLLARLHPEMLSALQLGSYGDGLLAWRALRATLLRLTRAWPRTPAAVLRLARALQRAGAWRRPLFYYAVLDYFYWTGVEAELAEAPVDGALAALASELRHGPIGLLLHR
jgi:glycosyltransferase involved in cell wall biosynthesis